MDLQRYKLSHHSLVSPIEWTLGQRACERHAGQRGRLIKKTEHPRQGRRMGHFPVESADGEIVHPGARVRKEAPDLMVSIIVLANGEAVVSSALGHECARSLPSAFVALNPCGGELAA